MSIQPSDLMKMIADNYVDKIKPENLPSAERWWTYPHGLFMDALHRIYEYTGEEKYLLYTKEWADIRIDEDGEFLFKDMMDSYGFPYLRIQLDAIQPGLPFFKLYEIYKDTKYKNVIENLFKLLSSVPKTSDGGYWHIISKPNQMWLDGLYMAEPFVMRYYLLTGKKECLDMVWKQVKLMTEHTLDKKTGLLYHAWDESKEETWADKETGCSPIFWSRSLGWYGVALTDILDDFPRERAEYEQMKKMLQRFITSIIKYQDESGLWYQVINKGDREDNWLETSCACLYLYVISKCIRTGILDDKYIENAKRAYEGILQMSDIDEDKNVTLKGVCKGINVGEYEFYINAKRGDNDLHGIGACLLALSEYSKLLLKFG